MKQHFPFNLWMQNMRSVVVKGVFKGLFKLNSLQHHNTDNRAQLKELYFPVDLIWL